MSVRRSIAWVTARHSAAIWTAYAIVECWLLSIVPWLTEPAFSYKPLHGGMTALLFLIYPACGFALGIAFGLALHSWSPPALIRPRTDDGWILKAAATWTLVIVYTAIVSFLLPRGIALVVPFVNALLMTAALVSVAIAPGALRRARFVAGPWFAAVMLPGVPWLTKQQLILSSNVGKALGAGASWLVAVAVGLAVQEFLDRRRAARLASVGPWRLGHAALVPAAVMTLIISLSVDQVPYTSGVAQPASQGVGKRQPVILIVLDTVRADHLSIYGYRRKTTPSLEEFARDATLYTHGVAAADVTLTSHASMFTGLYPSQHGAYYAPPDFAVGHPLEPQFRTLAEIFADAGYRTLGLVANHGYLGHSFGFSQGFQYYDQRVPVRFLAHQQGQYLRQAVRNGLAALATSPEPDLVYRTADEINKEAFKLLDELGGERAFFLFINYMDAHWPYRPPPPFDSRFPGRRDGLFSLNGYGEIAEEVMKLRRTITPEGRAHLSSLYDGAIAYLDSRLGALVARLKQLGVYDDSLIIMTSDHGETFGERNLMGHGVSVYQDQIYVPFIIKYPAGHQPGVFERPVSHVDLLPTILDASGFQVPAGGPGRSLLADSEPDRLLISESFPRGVLVDLSPRFRRVERALVAGRLKLITSTTGKRELYDLGIDADERRDLSHDRRAAATLLATSLTAWVDSAARQPRSPAKIDKQTLERLRSLGYAR